DEPAKVDPPSQGKPRRARREQMSRVELVELRVPHRVEGELCDDAYTHSLLDVRLDHVGIERSEDDVGLEPLGAECGIDLRASGKTEVIGHDRITGKRLERKRLDLCQRVTPGNEHAAIPRIAGK